MLRLALLGVSLFGTASGLKALAPDETTTLLECDLLFDKVDAFVNTDEDIACVFKVIENSGTHLTKRQEYALRTKFSPNGAMGPIPYMQVPYLIEHILFQYK